MKSNSTNAGQIAILAGLIGLFVAIIVFAPMFDSTPLATTNKKLRAKAGTEREGARALVSDSASSTPKDQLHGTRDKPLEAWDAPKNWERLKHTQDNQSPRLAVVAEVLNTLSPEDGIAHVRALLSEPEPDTTFALYAALGRLYAFRDPADLAAAAEAYDQAIVIAPDAEARHAIVHDRIVAMHESSSPEEVLGLIEEAIRPEDTASLATLQLELLRAAALDQLDRAEDAVAIYADVMDRALPMREENALQAEDLYRQSAMRLARVYRVTGQTEQASAVARKVKLTLSE